MVAIKTDTTSCNKAYSVILIEDDHMVSALIKSYLEKFGFSVYQVSQIEQVQNQLIPIEIIN